MTEKQHAKDYLLELAANSNTAGWLRDLIIRTVVSNGDLSEEDLTQTAAQLKANATASLAMPGAATGDAATEIRLTKLIHHSGVNALAAEQTIAFSPDVTLLYGHNGTGKSGYFRVLNEIVGGSQPLRVYGDVFSTALTPVNVELQYTENGTPKTLHWSNGERGIAPLTQTSVFDSSYTKLLLDRRSADTAIVRPLGLHLFSALTAAMTAIRERLGSEIEAVRRTLPQIKQDHLSDEVRNILNQQTYRRNQKGAIEGRYTMPEEKQKELADTQRQLNELNATNYDDKIKLAQAERSQVESLRNHLQTCLNNLTQYEQSITSLYERLKAARTAQEQAHAKIKVLGEIGNTNSSEWKAFIETGARYKAQSTLPVKVCPYCRQPLQGDAVQIVQAYADFLNDQSAATYNALVKEKGQLQTKVTQVVTRYNLTEALLQILEKQENGEDIKTYVNNCLSCFEETKKNLLASFQTEQFQANEAPKGNGALGKIVANYDIALDKLKTLKANKDEQIKALKAKAVVLLEHQAIAQQKDMFADWFGKMNKVRELSECQNELSTKTITSLAKTAGQQLITETLRERFQEELKALKMGYLEVSLGEEGARSGQFYMRIKLPVNYNTQEILSEGEQKGVALALFLAERRMQSTGNPIILDDPVNSLDHRITALLMERLVQLGNQIIIFSHNILLRDSLLALHTVHECNVQEVSGCQKQSKHLYLYNVNVRKQRKGHIRSSKQDNARYLIEEARSVLKKDDFEESVDGKVCAELLREAIEKLVDEKVFKNLVPIRYRGGKNQAIHWSELKTLHADPQQVDLLQQYYNRLSGGGLHLGSEQQENPVEWSELNEIAVNLFAQL